MADKFASPQAEDKAEELGVALEDVKGTGADGGATVADVEGAAGSEGKFLVHVNPSLGIYSYSAYDENGGEKVFYRDPYPHPGQVERQTLSEEEFAKYTEEREGVKILVKAKSEGGEN